MTVASDVPPLRLPAAETTASTTAESTAETADAGPHLPTRIRPRRHPGRWATAVLALFLLAVALHSVLSNHAFQWGVVARYFTSAGVLDGLVLTLWLTAVVTGLGFALGAGIAALRISANPVLRSLAWGYLWVFRATPVLVQLLLWYNIGLLYPTLSIGVPFGPTLASVSTVNLLGGTATAVIGLTLHEAAYAAEVVRGGLLAVDAGQHEAAAALGLGRLRTLLRIVLPQAMRSIVPAAGNMLIGTLKSTSIVSVLAVVDLLYSVQIVYNRTYQVIPLLLVAALWYLVVTSVLTVGQFFMERRVGRSNR
ncbi:polar amino acid transport system permease protein [Streptacidiphilus sp. BW17]|uniref:amino acid ABC transporter permease n=1 Tax=Streptacidiphilus sp. BW17 TaxID=3156274 RepID=UPI003513B622